MVNWVKLEGIYVDSIKTKYNKKQYNVKHLLEERG